MRGLIPDNILEDILSRIDIVEVISGYLPLKRAGRNFRANCPFHHEKTPSFMVSPERQIYHCFGCHESGNAFKFLMRHERMEFPEAVQMLAKKAGVILPEAQKTDVKTASLITSLFTANEMAARFYESQLNTAQGSRAKDYLLKRGISDDSIKLFKLGFAPEKWDALIGHLRAKDFSLGVLEKAGLIVAKQGGGYYDRFRARIIFPILDIKSRPLGFGARVLDASLPKYINSPETPVYVKGNNLYGLHLSKDSIRDSDSAIVVEGYLDFILPYQLGIKNIVASQGTALTLEQVRLLKRYTHNIIMVYDADTAGESAALRSLDIFVEEEMNVRVVTLGRGLDPDLCVRKEGAEGLKKKIEEARGLFDYKLQILKSRYDFKDIEDKTKICVLMLETITKIKNAVLRSEYVKRLAQELDISEDAVIQEAKKIKDDKPHYAPSRLPDGRKALNINPTEKLLIKMMLEEAHFIRRIKESLEPADFQDERLSRIISVMFDLAEQGKNIEPRILIDHLKDEEVSQFICESMFLPEEATEEHKEKIVDDCVRRIRQERLKLKKHDLHKEIKAAENLGDEDKLNRLLEEFHHLFKRGE